jgi:hypothetical protein
MRVLIMLKRYSMNANKRRHRMMYVFLSKYPEKEVTKPTVMPEGNGILIFKSELDYISRCILDRRDIETGGQLFGYWSEDGRPVVMYAIGPGPRANHQKTFFNQDVDYLVSVGRALKENFGLHHIGEWHSHHQLGLAKPSTHDANTMISTIREKDLGQFLLCIGNCTRVASSLKGFVCDSHTCNPKDWDVIYSDSPIRKEIDIKLANLLQHPITTQANHLDESLNNKINTTPKYTDGYWLKEPGNGVILNDIMNYLRRRHPRAEVRAQMNQAGEVVLNISDYRDEIKILFPRGFPDKSPEIAITRYSRLKHTSSPVYWHYMKGNIIGSFIHFYETI